MNLSQFFVDRPIFAAVLSIVDLRSPALIAMFALPICEYPEVVPPTVVVRAHYPGANPQVIAETVATPLEEQINGVENMLYMSSQATSDGVLTLTVTFKLGTDVDQAQVQVQNRVAQALPRLPEEVRQLGVTTVKSSPDLTMVVHLISPDGRYDMLYLRNYAVLHVKDELARIPGVGEVQLFGAGDYAMRVWLDPEQGRRARPDRRRVVDAIREQNVQVAAGVVGAAARRRRRGRLPAHRQHAGPPASTRRSSATSSSRPAPTAQITRLRDVARIELGAGQLRAALAARQQAGGRRCRSSRRPASNALAALRRRARDDGRAEEGLPAGRRLQHRLRPDRRSCAARSRRWCTRCSRRSCWWCSWWSCSCRPGAPRSSRWWRCRCRSSARSR